MELKDYIKLLADKDNKSKIDQPTKMPDDLDKLVKGLQRAQAVAYDYMSYGGENAKDCNMEQLANAINIVQFATAHITSIYNSYYDLMNRIKVHNEKIAEKKN